VPAEAARRDHHGHQQDDTADKGPRHRNAYNGGPQDIRIKRIPGRADPIKVRALQGFGEPVKVVALLLHASQVDVLEVIQWRVVALDVPAKGEVQPLHAVRLEHAQVRVVRKKRVQRIQKRVGERPHGTAREGIDKPATCRSGLEHGALTRGAASFGIDDGGSSLQLRIVGDHPGAEQSRLFTVVEEENDAIPAGRTFFEEACDLKHRRDTRAIVTCTWTRTDRIVVCTEHDGFTVHRAFGGRHNVFHPGAGLRILVARHALDDAWLVTELLQPRGDAVGYGAIRGTVHRVRALIGQEALQHLLHPHCREAGPLGRAGWNVHRLHAPPCHDGDDKKQDNR